MRFLFLLTLAMASSIAAANTPAPLPDWMTGAWDKSDGAKWADEYWTPPRAGMMIGASRSGEGEMLEFWEHMRIERGPDGKLAFVAIAADQQPVRFGAVRAGQTEIIFENPDHDYPQRIRYWREGDILKAEISLLDGSKAVQFLFNRMGG
ncbi:DUF6265 family protein [Sphingorhabdus sp.]|uniref:DUF6265 family protein n=1 Tax=Sphingorhabdus sp. TaxID=1902408 RepID=UPI003C745570